MNLGGSNIHTIAYDKLIWLLKALHSLSTMKSMVAVPLPSVIPFTSHSNPPKYVYIPPTHTPYGILELQSLFNKFLGIYIV